MLFYTYVIDNSINHIGNINPIRWKSYYYDIETGLYYIDGRYYDSRLGLYLNADNTERVMDNVYLMNGLDRHAVTLDNLISKEVNDITVFTYDDYLAQIDRIRILWIIGVYNARKHDLLYY